MFQKITLLALVLVAISCQKKESVEKDKIKIADWLIGNWENKSPDGALSENWIKERGRNIIWLHPDHRGRLQGAQMGTVVLSLPSGSIIIIRLKEGN